MNTLTLAAYQNNWCHDDPIINMTTGSLLRQIVSTTDPAVDLSGVENMWLTSFGFFLSQSSPERPLHEDLRLLAQWFFQMQRWK